MAGPDLEDVPPEFRAAVGAALTAAGVEQGHVALELVDEQRIRELNREHRDRDRPTDVLAFPIDESGPVAGPRELGDIVICPEHCTDLTEAAVHGTLHLCGYDHETDEGEMLALQAEVLAVLGHAAGPSPAEDSGEAVPGADDAAEGGAKRPTRAGFVGLAGRPNAGKSTLVNAIVGAHVAIVSMRPQTTRRAVRGVATDLAGGNQLILVDLPGVQRPRDLLTERMQRRVERELADADAVLIVINGEEGVGPGDRFIATTLLKSGVGVPVICAVNKTDRMDRAQMLRTLTAAAELDGVKEVFPVSALTGEGVPVLVECLAGLMPESPLLYPAEDRTDQSEELLFAELIREQVLLRTRDEIPHSVEVSVKEIERRDDGLVEIEAEIWPETESQKGILIGKGGRKIQEIGTAARRRLEAELGARVYLDLQVRVRRHWRRDESLLDRLGIE